MASNETNQAKLREAFEAHYEAVNRYCHRRLPASEASDVTAEVFAVAWGKIDAMPGGEMTLPWLYGVARNRVKTAQRSFSRRLRLQQKLGGQAHHPDPGPEAVIVRNAEQQELLDAMAKLRPEDQEVLRLRAYEHLSSSQIAVVLGCTPEAAKKRSTRALQRLRRSAGIPDVSVGTAPGTPVPEGGET